MFNKRSINFLYILIISGIFTSIFANFAKLYNINPILVFYINFGITCVIAVAMRHSYLKYGNHFPCFIHSIFHNQSHDKSSIHRSAEKFQEKISIYSEQSRSYFIALEQEQKLCANSLTIGLVNKMGLDNLAKYLPDLNIPAELYPSISSLKPNDVQDDGWLLRMLFNSESAIKFFRDKKSTYICYGEQRAEIPENKLEDNFKLLYWLDDYLEQPDKRIEVIFHNQTIKNTETKTMIIDVLSVFSPMTVQRS